MILKKESVLKNLTQRQTFMKVELRTSLLPPHCLTSDLEYNHFQKEKYKLQA